MEISAHITNLFQGGDANIRLRVRGFKSITTELTLIPVKPVVKLPEISAEAELSQW